MNIIQAIKSGISQARVRELFEYQDGQLFWRLAKSRNVWPGKSAGSLGGNGYYKVKVDKQNYSLHRLIWIYHRGDAPALIDHIDGNPLNNRIENLRAATRWQNTLNRRGYGSTPFKGVYPGRRDTWQAFAAGRYLGQFETQEAAARAYDKAALEAFGDFARLNFSRDLGLGLDPKESP